MSDSDRDLGNFLAGFVVGGLIGAAAALLMAPQSGEETRAVIREKGIELKDKAVETAEDARLRAEKALEDARMRADEAVEEVRVRTDELSRLARERATELQARGQTVLTEQKSKISSAIDVGRKAADKATHPQGGEPQADEPSSSPSI